MNQTLNIDDIARVLRVCPKTIRRYVAAGTLPPPLPLGGRRQRWSADVVNQFLSQPATPILVDTAIPATVSSTPMPIITPEVF